jgi:hypothetical protein
VQLGGHGARGGYAYVCEIGSCGTKWFIKRPNKSDPWGIRVSASSAALASKGIEGFRAYLNETLCLFGIKLEEDAVSITRVDFAVDLLAPGFVLERNNVVTHARSNISDHDVENTVNTNGRSSRTTSITIGKMPGRQTIIYDKREEIMVKRKHEWFTIWNRRIKELGLPELAYSDPKEARVWRIEARAGKDHLQGKWGIRGWGSLYEKLPALFADSFQKVRYCTETSDNNRSRWPTHPLWELADTTVQARLLEHSHLITAEEIVEIRKEELLETLMKQILGSTTTLAAIEKRDAFRFDDYLHLLARRLEALSRSHKLPLEDRLERARGRYPWFD